MAYKVQLGAAHLNGLVSGSSTIRAVGSLSSSGDIAVTGAVHAASLFGDGSGLTNISADGIDVTSSAGNLAYNIVFTEGAQTDGSLGLGLNTALNYNPSTGLISSSAGMEVVGAVVLVNTLSVSGAVSGAIGVSGSAALFDGQVSASVYYGDGSNLSGVDSVSGSDRQYSATGMETSGYLKVSGSTTLAGALSSSAAAEIVGNVLLGGQLGISGGIQYQVTTITTNTHLTASTATTYQVVSGGTTALTVMLPSASAGENYQYAVKRHALMSGAVTITGSDIADVIDGNAQLELETPGASVFLISDGTQWNIF